MSASVTIVGSAALKLDRVRAALTDGLIADALSMPVHWFYNVADIYRMFGKTGITKFEPAPKTHPSSIMSLHSTSRGGRGSQSDAKSVVGDVILKGRKKFWNQSNMHYHNGMLAGENTLNADCARLLTRVLTRDRSYVKSNFLDAYIEFMQDPDSYNDTYAESYHRSFFANLVFQGKPKDQCGEKTHDTPSIGAFVTIVPVVLAEFLLGQDLAKVQSVAREHLYLTHPDAGLAKYCDEFVSLIEILLTRGSDEDQSEARKALAASFKRVVGKDLQKLVSETKDDSRVVGGMFSPACYIDGSFPSILYLAYKYADVGVETSLLRNTNLGGENCHRGYVLGAIMGLIRGEIPRLAEELDQSEVKRKEIQDFLDAFN